MAGSVAGGEGLDGGGGERKEKDRYREKSSEMTNFNHILICVTALKLGKLADVYEAIMVKIHPHEIKNETGKDFSCRYPLQLRRGSTLGR